MPLSVHGTVSVLPTVFPVKKIPTLISRATACFVCKSSPELVEETEDDFKTLQQLIPVL